MADSPVMSRRLLATLGLAASFVVGCNDVVGPGTGTLAGSRSAPPTTESTDPSESTEPSETSETSETSTETTETTLPTESTSTSTGGQPTESSDPEQLVAAEAVGATFELAVNVGNLDIAYELLCSVDRSEVSVEDFSSDAPPEGTFSLEIIDEVSPGVFRAEATFEGDVGDVYLRSEGGSYCLSQEP